jgi:hypothetical protein
MRTSLPRRPLAVASVVVLASLVFLPACSSSLNSTAPTTLTPTTVSSPSTSATPTASTVPGGGYKEALGTNNPAAGDCTTNTSEAATSVGFVVLKVTASSFQAEIQLQKGVPNTTYGVFMQQVPGSCPQNAANGGTLTTGSTGRGEVSAVVARVPGATTFFVQLVSTGSGPAQFTSDRISGVS